MQDSKREYSKIIDELQVRRDRFIDERRELRALAFAVAINFKDHEVAEFAANIVAFFARDEQARWDIQKALLKTGLPEKLLLSPS